MLQLHLGIVFPVNENDHECRIQYPNRDEMNHYSLMIERKYNLLGGCFAVLDGTTFEIKQQRNFSIQEQFYSGFVF